MGTVQADAPEADQVIVGRLFDCAKLYIQAGVMVSRPCAFEAIIMAILAEQHNQLERAQRLLDELQSHM